MAFGDLTKEEKESFAQKLIKMLSKRKIRSKEDAKREKKFRASERVRARSRYGILFKGEDKTRTTEGRDK